MVWRSQEGYPGIRTDLTWTKLSLGREVEFLCTKTKHWYVKNAGKIYFSAGEQEFYAEKGFTNEPAVAGLPSGAETKRPDDDRGRRNCGATTQVPFTPSQDRPVYCKECYDAMKGLSDY